ncbi:BA75_02905T0 [Komagataella pastoris]|uniref:BA75_02905T0 n=1 Tax=Komagataella pastoris TaxID=4922 RepID=A0A1B2JAQ1_PICPA|nr:BA75_02905T0 [Komagataella pastoris]
MTRLNRSCCLMLVALCFVGFVTADDDHDSSHMDMSAPKEFHPINPRSKTFHWLLSLAILFMLPSVSAAYCFADRYVVSSIMQIICACYAVFEVLVLSFPDSDGVENRTSVGTGWVLAILYCVTVFFGSLTNGSEFLLRNKQSDQWLSALGHTASRRVYKTLSVFVVLVGWVKVCLAPIALFGFCRGRSTGQCIAHGIMGSSFIWYGFILLLVLVIPWLRLRETGYSQEFFDSLLMTAWGCVNTFTEHRWGREAWSHGDYQHTSMGIIWWCGGLLGLWLTRNGERSYIPALLLMFTGYGMAEHVQKLQISTKVHAFFGLALIGGGLARIVEISFVLKDKRHDSRIHSFQYLPSFALVEAGVLFMGATEEQLQLVKDLGADHSSYILVVSGAAFMIQLWFLLILELYLKLATSEFASNGDYTLADEEFELSDLSPVNTHE